MKTSKTQPKPCSGFDSNSKIWFCVSSSKTKSFFFDNSTCEEICKTMCLLWALFANVMQKRPPTHAVFQKEVGKTLQSRSFIGEMELIHVEKCLSTDLLHMDSVLALFWMRCFTPTWKKNIQIKHLLEFRCTKRQITHKKVLLVHFEFFGKNVYCSKLNYECTTISWPIF